MKPLRLMAALTLGLALVLALCISFSRAQPGNPLLAPPRNSHTAPPTTTISITYDEPISVSTVTSRTFAVQGMQSGLVTATHAVRQGLIIVTPTQPFHQGELVYVVATTHTLNVTGVAPLSSTQWQFNAGVVTTRCLASFVDAGAALTKVIDSSVAWGDYDGDGDLDILLAGESLYTYTTQVYRNEGGGTFTNISTSLPGVRNGSAAWGDYDNDADLDILLSGWDASETAITRLYRNDGGGTFTDINASLTDVGDSSVAWGDYDNDGDLDILLSGDSSLGEVTQVYRNDGGGTFITKTDAFLRGVYFGSVAWGDYDNDGDLDVLLSGRDGGTFFTELYRNDGGGPFVKETNASLPGVAYGSLAWGDYDDDGDLDILLSGLDNSGSTSITRVYRNDGEGTFTEESHASLPGVQSSSVAWGDYDNDGDLDILLVGREGFSAPIARVYRNDGGGTFSNINASLRGVRFCSAAWGDYDDDGDLDILLAGQDASAARIARVYRNDDCPPALALTKHVIAPADNVAVPGQAITYTLTFSNAGGVAGGVVITDVVPVSVTVRSVVSRGVALADAGVSPGYVWSVNKLAFGARGAITISGVLSEPLTAGTFTNTATITCNGVESDTTDNLSAAQMLVLNVAPSAENAAWLTDEETPLQNVLNASDANGDVLIYGILSGPATGAVTITDTATASLIYTPTNRTTSYNDTFTFAVTDTAGLTGTATVSVNVSADNDPPWAQDDVENTSEDAGISGHVVAGDPDTNDTLSYALTAQPTYGNAGVDAGGHWTYAPANRVTDYTDAFTVTVTDGGGNSGAAIVTVHVTANNDPPIASDDVYTTLSETPLLVLAATGVLSNDLDVEGSPLTATLVHSPAHGNLVLEADGAFVYTPTVGFSGQDTFTYHANDGLSDSNVATVTLRVIPVYRLYLPIIGHHRKQIRTLSLTSCA